MDPEPTVKPPPLSPPPGLLHSKAEKCYVLYQWGIRLSGWAYHGEDDGSPGLWGRASSTSSTSSTSLVPRCHGVSGGLSLGRAPAQILGTIACLQPLGWGRLRFDDSKRNILSSGVSIRTLWIGESMDTPFNMGCSSIPAGNRARRSPPIAMTQNRTSPTLALSSARGQLAELIYNYRSALSSWLVSVLARCQLSSRCSQRFFLPKHS